MVLAVAGRRIDRADAPRERFPSRLVPVVRERIQTLLGAERPDWVVCSAACGADLLTLEAAQAASIRRVIVLPFASDIFRVTSVADCGGDWGRLYDELIGEAGKTGDLLILDCEPSDPQAAFSQATLAIIEAAQRLACEFETFVLAASIWDGDSHSQHDFTNQFESEARQRGLPVARIAILTASS